jgi:hypothetical protein
MSKKKDRNKHAGQHGNPPPPQDPKQQADEVSSAESKLRDLGLSPTAEPAPPSETLKALLDRTFGVFRALEAQQRKLEETERKHREGREENDRVRHKLEAWERELKANERKLEDQQTELRQEKAKTLNQWKELAQLQTKAEGGFVEEREQILAGVKAQRERLQEEHKKLTAAIDLERTQSHDELRERRQVLLQELDALRTAEGNRITKWVMDRRSELEEELAEARGKLAADQAGLAKRRAELEASEMVLSQDRAALEKKVERLAEQKASHKDDEFRRLADENRRISQERDDYYRELEALRSLQQAFEGRPATAVVQELRDLRDQRAELHRQVQLSPTAADRQRLVQLEQDRKSWEEERYDLQRQLSAAEAAKARIIPSSIALEDARSQIQALEASRRLLQRQLDELKAEIQKYTEADNQNNPLQALVDFDNKPELNDEIHHTAQPVLAQFAEDLRTRLASGIADHPRLYYEPRDLRSFVAGMAMSRLILLQGNSGTGKTSLATGAAAAMGGGCTVVSVQAGWRDRQDLLGYYNAFHRRYYQTPFTEALYKAGTPRYRQTPFFIVLDEINLSRVEQFFADFLSALELKRSDRRIRLMANQAPKPPQLMPDGLHLPIPENVWFIGTANHDETTTDFADKTYDRAHVLELPRLDERIATQVLSSPLRLAPIGVTGLMTVFEEAQHEFKETIQHVTSWMGSGSPIALALEKHASVTLGNRLDKQIACYLPVVLAMNGSISEAMDHVLQTRVLRKVRDRHSILREDLEQLQACLEKEWKTLDPENPKDLPVRSLALLAKEIQSKR